MPYGIRILQPTASRQVETHEVGKMRVRVWDPSKPPKKKENGDWNISDSIGERILNVTDDAAYVVGFQAATGRIDITEEGQQSFGAAQVNDTGV